MRAHWPAGRAQTLGAAAAGTVVGHGVDRFDALSVWRRGGSAISPQYADRTEALDLSSRPHASSSRAESKGRGPRRRPSSTVRSTGRSSCRNMSRTARGGSPGAPRARGSLPDRFAGAGFEFGGHFPGAGFHAIPAVRRGLVRDGLFSVNYLGRFDPLRRGTASTPVAFPRASPAGSAVRTRFGERVQEPSRGPNPVRHLGACGPVDVAVPAATIRPRARRRSRRGCIGR